MASNARRGARRALAVAVLAAAGLTAPSALADPLTRAEMDSRVELLKAVNTARIARGIRPLRMSRVLNRPAVRHSQWLAARGLLTHTGSDGSPFYVRLYAAGFSRRRAVAENLGMVGGCSLNDQRLMVKMWLASPGHRRNLLDPSYRVVGLAVVQADNCAQTVYTTDFGG